jgi:hypothetical protein
MFRSDKIRRLAPGNCDIAPVREPANFPYRLKRLATVITAGKMYVAANGFGFLHTESRITFVLWGVRLRIKYGFRRTGQRVLGVVDESVYLDFVRGPVKLLAGRDNWCGFHLLADDRESDAFLRRFYELHVAPDRMLRRP